VVLVIRVVVVCFYVCLFVCLLSSCCHFYTFAADIVEDDGDVDYQPLTLKKSLFRAVEWSHIHSKNKRRISHYLLLFFVFNISTALPPIF
jgi:hypothetical protein